MVLKIPRVGIAGDAAIFNGSTIVTRWRWLTSRQLMCARPGAAPETYRPREQRFLSRSLFCACPQHGSSLPNAFKNPRDSLKGIRMDLLTLYGAAAVTAMLVFYALERRSAHFVLAFVAACLASAAYGFLQGAWPFGVVESIWSVVAVRRWWQRR